MKDAVIDELGEALLLIKRMLAKSDLLHINLGECPAPDQPDARDDGCTACKCIMRAERALKYAEQTLDVEKGPAQ